MLPWSLTRMLLLSIKQGVHRRSAESTMVMDFSWGRPPKRPSLDFWLQPLTPSFREITQEWNLPAQHIRSSFGTMVSSMLNALLLGQDQWLQPETFKALVIDDFFAISVEPKSDGRMSRSVKAFNTAQRAYHDFSLIGSPDKDVKGATRAKVIGAEVAADEVALSCKCPSVSAPAQKRFGLSWISFQIAQLSHTMDSLHLSLLGGWTSVLMFRRPFMSILQEAFHLVPSIEVSDKHAKLVPLPRRVATELVLLACLAPLIKTDISVPFCEKLFATDASSDRGAVVSNLRCLRICTLPCLGVARVRVLTPASFPKMSHCSANWVLVQALWILAVALCPSLSHFVSSFIEIFAGSAKVTNVMLPSLGTQLALL